MIANNGKISQKQLRCLMVMDWIGKQCLLLPVLLQPLGSREKLCALVLAGAGICLYGCLVGRLCESVDTRFGDYTAKRLGRGTACLMGLVFLLYLLLNQVYLTRAAARVCRVFLLPEAGEQALCFWLVFAGMAAQIGNRQKRARAAQCLYPLVLTMLALLILASVGSVHTSLLRWEGQPPKGGVFWQQVSGAGVGILAAFSGMGVLLYEAPYLSERGKTAETVCRSVLLVLAGMGVLFVLMIGSFGGEALKRLEWPVLVLMSNVNLPGDFLQRWDMVFLGVLLFSLLVASGTGIHYMSRILQELLPKRLERKWESAGAAFVVLAAALAAGSYEQIVAIYRKWAYCCMAPFMLGFPILLLVVERVRKKKKEAV